MSYDSPPPAIPSKDDTHVLTTDHTLPTRMPTSNSAYESPLHGYASKPSADRSPSIAVAAPMGDVRVLLLALCGVPCCLALVGPAVTLVLLTLAAAVPVVCVLLVVMVASLPLWLPLPVGREGSFGLRVMRLQRWC